ncbi:hypothetical protein A2154_04100 [Candidatus Gottesmanbacteria bacterium RBG_16_43_7]|uniref:Uncharacterized protein n=1 Tax=Candidatus Gottesmanbacteria bacterium RBG_16_43_7 TaxID=1798373 RepID=A0A1F5Z9P2_9BACT|nr:MAG: hypothetical protein A2154_04100 [Candidatus Gottesmanbacteria bacterium RBG_16_43_7]
MRYIFLLLFLLAFGLLFYLQMTSSISFLTPKNGESTYESANRQVEELEDKTDRYRKMIENVQDKTTDALSQ